MDCDCGHSFEDHVHESGLQSCKKCDCESAGRTEMTDIDYGKENKRSNKRLIIGGIVVSIIAIISIISFTNPIMLIGGIWDADIENQLLKTNDEGLEYFDGYEIDSEGNKIPTIEGYPDLVRISFTYDNNADTEIRVARAINTFEKLFSDPDKESKVIRSDETTQIQFTWKPE